MAKASGTPKHKGLTLIVGLGNPSGMPGSDGQEPLARRRQHAADVEADFLGRPQPHGTFDTKRDSGRVTAQAAGYRELEGAAKDGECDLVAVPAGVSAGRGCCNLFEPDAGAARFACGSCEHFQAQATPSAAERQEAWHG